MSKSTGPQTEARRNPPTRAETVANPISSERLPGEHTAEATDDVISQAIHEEDAVPERSGSERGNFISTQI